MSFDFINPDKLIVRRVIQDDPEFDNLVVRVDAKVYRDLSVNGDISAGENERTTTI